MMRSLYSGVSGLRTHQTKMDVIGNNIANVNTVGFKSTAVTFSDIMYQTTSGASGATETLGGRNANQIGLGVATGATKISIESGGAAQSTGEAFDIRLSDSNATNFFVVSNGSQNLFTRAGSFYIDGAGNLAMTSTGYMVQGWQVDPDTGYIRKDTVSPLRIMQPGNMTASPEATTDAYVSGVLDKYDKDAASDDGYKMAVSIYDALGYEYTVKFSVKAVDVESGKYSVALDSIINNENVDVLNQWLEEGNGNSLDQIFGLLPNEAANYPDKQPQAQGNYNIDQERVTTQRDGKTYAMSNPPVMTKNADDDWCYRMVALNDDGTENTTDFFDARIGDIYEGMDNDTINNILDSNGKISVDAGVLKVSFTPSYEMSFNTSDGTLLGVNGIEGESNLVMNLKDILGDAFEDVNVDFSSVLNYNNGGSSTMGLDRGQLSDPSQGAGRKLGSLIGLSVGQNGEIWGAYSNGKNMLLAQIAVAQFANPSGLESLGNNCYAETLNSGEFDGIGVDITADGGSMRSGQLEMSNVDLSQEFTDMITTQRGFQANSRIITVSDTMLEELTNLKR